MRFWEFTRSPASARLLVDFGQERGLSPAKLLAGTQLSLAQLSDPNMEVTATQELRVVSNLLRLLKHPPGLGLELGLRYHFSAYGVWGYGLISSATAGDAMALALRFLPLTYAFTVITYHEEGHLAVLSFGEPELADEVKRFVVERDMVAAAVLLQEIGGDDFALSRFTLRACPPPVRGPSPVRRKLFAAQPEYSSHINSLAFDRSFLSRPLPHANPLTASMCEQMCSRLIEARRLRVGTTAMIRHYLSAAPGTTLSTLSSMARLMNTSERTLKRRLHDEGTTFRALVAESRCAMAKALLIEGELALGEIAERLGFADLSTFSQAFKRWNGVAPSTFRSQGASIDKEPD